ECGRRYTSIAAGWTRARRYVALLSFGNRPASLSRLIHSSRPFGESGCLPSLIRWRANAAILSFCSGVSGIGFFLVCWQLVVLRFLQGRRFLLRKMIARLGVIGNIMAARDVVQLRVH